MFPFLVLLSAKFIFNVCDLMVICFFFSFLDPQNKSAASISQRVICFSFGYVSFSYFVGGIFFLLISQRVGNSLMIESDGPCNRPLGQNIYIYII